MGAGNQGLTPKSASCMRDFKTDEVKNFNAMSPIEEKYQKGLLDQAALWFSMPDESNANLVVTSLIAFEERMINHGMEGVFHIIRADGTVLNMLQEPGMCTTSVIDSWCVDLLVIGARTKRNPSSRSPLCNYDRTNLMWSGEALLNSCTEALKKDLKLSVMPNDRNGPKLLMALITKIYRPSLSKIEALKDSLKGLNLHSFPAENVTLFVQDATKLVREIKMNYMSNYSIPDLTAAALSGLTVASDPLLLAQVRNLRIQSDVNGFCLPPGRGTLSLPVPDTLEALKMINELYRVLVNQSDYGPARKPVHKANLAGVGKDSKLEQHRDSAGGAGSNAGRRNKCWDCESPDHMRGDPSCPNPKKRDGKPRVNHGLDEATSLKVSEMAKEKEKTMPKRQHVPDDARYTIEIDGKVVAEFCRHCGRFVKGASMHPTKEHKGKRNLYPHVPLSGSEAQVPAASPAPSPTAAAQLAPVQLPSVDAFGPPQDLPVPAIDTDIFMARSANYDFGDMPYVSANVAGAIHDLEQQQHKQDSSLPLVADPEEAAFLAMLVKEYGG